MNNLREIIKETLGSHLDKTLILKEDVKVSKTLSYHINEGMSLNDNVFKTYSQKYFDLINEVRGLWNEGKIDLNEKDTLMVESDLGVRVKKGDEMIYLDAPYIFETETEKNILNKPEREGSNKFAVYVKTPNNGVKKITFGDPKLKIKNDYKGDVNSFREKHKCDQKKDKTTPGYWVCNVGRYSKQLGL
jgi:hypothetical protein